MMSLPRSSIRAMLFGVLLVAGNCAAWRSFRLSSHANPGFALGILSVMPMANILAIACYRKLTRVSPFGLFFVGFGLSGAMAMLIGFTLWRMAEVEWLGSMLVRFELGVDHSLNFYKIDANVKVYIFWIVFVFRFALLGTVPQLMAAMAGGWIARRYAANSATVSRGFNPPVLDSPPPATEH